MEEVKQKPKEIPKDFKQEKEPAKAPEPIVFVRADGLPKYDHRFRFRFRFIIASFVLVFVACYVGCGVMCCGVCCGV